MNVLQAIRGSSDRGLTRDQGNTCTYSHSIVAGGLLEIS